MDLSPTGRSLGSSSASCSSSSSYSCSHNRHRQRCSSPVGAAVSAAAVGSGLVAFLPFSEALPDGGSIVANLMSSSEEQDAVGRWYHTLFQEYKEGLPGPSDRETFGNCTWMELSKASECWTSASSIACCLPGLVPRNRRLRWDWWNAEPHEVSSRSQSLSHCFDEAFPAQVCCGCIPNLAKLQQNVETYQSDLLRALAIDENALLEGAQRGISTARAFTALLNFFTIRWQNPTQGIEPIVTRAFEKSEAALSILGVATRHLGSTDKLFELSWKLIQRLVEQSRSWTRILHRGVSYPDVKALRYALQLTGPRAGTWQPSLPVFREFASCCSAVGTRAPEGYGRTPLGVDLPIDWFCGNASIISSRWYQCSQPVENRTATALVVDEEHLELATVLEAIWEARSAGRGFAMAEIGSGPYAPWLQHAARVWAKVASPMASCSLLAVEPFDHDESRSFNALIKRHGQDRCQHVMFFDEAGSKGSLVTSALDTGAAQLSLPDGLWDLVDMDIQGEELTVIGKELDLLAKRTRRLHVSTHGRNIHHKVLEALQAAQWFIQYEQIPGSVLQVYSSMGPVATLDGHISAVHQEEVNRLKSVGRWDPS